MKVDFVAFKSEALFHHPPLGVFFYGSDEELMSYGLWDIREQLKRKDERLTRVDESAFIENPMAYLMPDLFSQEKRRLILVEHISEKQGAFYKDLLPTLKESILFLTSLNMRAASSFVQWALKHPRVWAIPCYSLERGAKLALVQKAAKHFNCEISSSLLQEFVPYLSVAELPHLFQKLILCQEGPITFKTLEACWGQDLLDQTDLAYTLSARDRVRLGSWLAQPSPDVLFSIRQALKHFSQLLAVQSALTTQESLETALSHLSPPIFFKQLPLFKSHLSQWSLPCLTRAIRLLVEAELAFKKGNLSQSYAPFLEAVVTLKAT